MGRLSVLAFLALALLAISLHDVQVSAEVVPTESECRPYIEKALNELKGGDADGGDSGETKKDASGESLVKAPDEGGEGDDDSEEAAKTEESGEEHAEVEGAEADEGSEEEGGEEGKEEEHEAEEAAAGQEDSGEEEQTATEHAEEEETSAEEAAPEGEDEQSDEQVQHDERANDDSAEADTEGVEEDSEATTTEAAAEGSEEQGEEEEGEEHATEETADEAPEGVEAKDEGSEEEEGAAKEHGVEEDEEEEHEGKEEEEEEEHEGKEGEEEEEHEGKEEEEGEEEEEEGSHEEGTKAEGSEEGGEEADEEEEVAKAEGSEEEVAKAEGSEEEEEEEPEGLKKKDEEEDSDEKHDDSDDSDDSDSGDSGEEEVAKRSKRDVEAGHDDDDDDKHEEVAEGPGVEESGEEEHEKDADDDDDSKEAAEEHEDASEAHKDDDSEEAHSEDHDADDESAEKQAEGGAEEEHSGEAVKEEEASEEAEATDNSEEHGEAHEDDHEESEEETRPEDDLLWEGEVPENLRSRRHIDDILHLDNEYNAKETAVDNVAEIILKDLKRIYENAIKPLEGLYKYRDLSNRHFGDPEIFSKPLVLFMGPWSGGKSTIINYLTGNEYTANSLRSGAEPSPAYFNILMYGDEPEVLDGTQLAADWTFSGLQKFGQGLEDRLWGMKLPNKLLEKVNIVEIPGILEVRKQVSRLFPFNDACQWFIDRADIIFLVYDPAKLDVGPETEAILDQLKGREYQTRIILNKADQVKPEELLRVQSALIWNISPLMSSAQPPVMYTVSLWSHPYEPYAPVRLFQAQERSFLRDLRTAIDKRIENKIASARRFAVRVRNHAKMVDCYLNTYYNHKTLFGNKKRIADQIIENPQDYHIYEGLSTLTNISRYDLPDPEVYRDFFRLNPLYDFKKLSQTCTYFRGCPINKLDVAIAYDLPELVGKYKKMAESALAKVESSDHSDTSPDNS